MNWTYVRFHEIWMRMYVVDWFQTWQQNKKMPKLSSPIFVSFLLKTDFRFPENELRLRKWTPVHTNRTTCTAFFERNKIQIKRFFVHSIKTIDSHIHSPTHSLIQYREFMCIWKLSLEQARGGNHFERGEFHLKYYISFSLPLACPVLERLRRSVVAVVARANLAISPGFDMNTWAECSGNTKQRL